MEFPAPPRLHVLHVPGADPRRDATVGELRRQATVCVHEDPARRGVMVTWLEALACAEASDQDIPWSVIVQDDVEPLPGWQQHLERACTYSPQPVLGLTHLGSYGRRALDRQAPYAVGKGLLWGAGIAYHRRFMAGLARWAPWAVEQTGYPHDDRLIAAYARVSGVETAMVARALFDLPRWPSLLGHPAQYQPNTTIINCSGPPYHARPRSARVSGSSGTAEEFARLVELGPVPGLDRGSSHDRYES